MAVLKKKRRKAKKFNAKTKLMNAMRRIWFYSPMRKEVEIRCRIDKETSRCERCRKLCDKIQVDHFPPVVPLVGWDSWQGVFDRMFVDPKVGLRGLCVECHDKITEEQRIERKKYK